MSDKRGNLSFASASIEQTVSVISRFLSSHQLLVSDRGMFGANLSRVRFDRITLIRLTYGAELEVRSSELRDEFFLLEIPLSGHSLTRSGGREVAVSQNVGCIVGPGSPFSSKWSADCSKLLFTIDRKIAETHLATLLGRSLREPLEFDAEMLLVSEGSRTLKGLIDLMAAEAEVSLQIPERRGIHGALETAFLTTLLFSQPNNHSDILQSTSSASTAPWYVRRAEEFIAQNLTRTVALHEIAAAVGVSERTLQVGFQRFRGASPMAYLRDRRLDHVNRLLTEDSVSGGVADIARASGFIDMGKFAKAYRQRFGSNPSEALRMRA